MNFSGKTIFITGASRGIGLAIAERLAKDGANIVIAAKTISEHPKLPGTIYTAKERIEELGGKALAIPVDIRDEENVEGAVNKALNEFGSIDVLVNNASAISLKGTLETSMKRFDLMHQVNVRGTFLCSQKCLPYLKNSENPHILNLSPPLNLNPKWFKNHTAYTMSKYGMSMCVLGMSSEFYKEGISVNALWPQTAIATSAVEHLPGGAEIALHSRTPLIMADAAYEILKTPKGVLTGNFFIDEELLKSKGISDFTKYQIDPNRNLYPDLFID